MLFPLLGAFLGYFLPKKLDTKLPSSFLFLLAICGLSLGITITLPISASLPQHAVENEKIYLHNLYDNPEIDGHFFLGSGSVNTDDMYHYNAIVPGYSTRYEYSKIAKVNAMVDENNPEQPYLQTYHMEYNQPWYVILGGFWPQGNLPKPIFNIPAGSVDNNFQTK